MSQVQVCGIGKFYRAAKERISVLDSLPLIGSLRRTQAKRNAAEDAAAFSTNRKKVRVQGLWALRNVSFEVASGETLGIIGPNGAGKSTLLRVLAKITMPTTGRIIGRGRLVSLLELGMGFQPELSARENIHLYGALYEVPQKIIEAQFNEIVAFAGIEKFVDSPLRTYSSGMYLRLAFSVALNLKPDVLLADEVLAVGDIAFQESCIERVQNLRRDGGTTLFVSHDMAAIRRICDRVLWLHQGEIRQIGTADDVVTAYESFMYKGEASTTRHKLGILAQSDHITLRSARLLNSAGDETGALRIGADAIFEVRLETRMPSLMFFVGIDVFGLTGAKQHILRAVQNAVPAPQPGLYIVTLRFPQECFVDIAYTVNVAAVAVMNGIEHAVVAQSALGFRGYMLSPTSKDMTFTGERGKGLFRPDVAWTVATPERLIQAS